MSPKRNQLQLVETADTFLEWTRDDDPGLHKSLQNLDAAGKRELGGVIGRFTATPSGAENPRVRLMVRRLVGRLHKPEAEMLGVLNRVLDYMDLNADARLEEAELELCLQLFERFSRVVSPNRTLSQVELELLYAVIRFSDRNGNGRLEEGERRQLMTEIQGGRSFLRRQYAENADFRVIADRHQLSF